MGSSQAYQISDIIVLIHDAVPRSILDVGTGKGKYGILSREYLAHQPELTIHGIEGFKDYITPVHKHAYDKLMIGDATEMILENKLPQAYDLVLLIDVLEHFDKATGQRVLNKLVEQNAAVLISTPKYVGEQEDERNAYQEHKSEWSLAELKSLATSHLVVKDPFSHLIMVGRQDIIDKVTKRYKRRQLELRVASNPVLHYIYRTFVWKKSIQK